MVACRIDSAHPPMGILNLLSSIVLVQEFSSVKLDILINSMNNVIKERRIATPRSMKRPPTESKVICSVSIIADAPVMATSLTHVR